MTAMTATSSPPVDHATEVSTVLRAVAVRKAYRRGLWPRRRVLSVLEGADLELEPGEIVGLVGENGSVKSTLMKILAGDLLADAGEVERSDSFGYCPQIPVLYERLTCDEHLDLFGAAYGLDPAQLERNRAALYESLDFERFADRRVEELSGGTRSKLNLAIALLHDRGGVGSTLLLLLLRLLLLLLLLLHYEHRPDGL